MSLSRWKMMAGVLGVSIGGLAAAASQCPKFDSSKGRQPEAPVALADATKLPPAGAPAAPSLPTPPALPVAGPAAPQLVPAGTTPGPAVELPKVPAPSGGLPPADLAFPTTPEPKPAKPADVTPLPALPGIPDLSTKPSAPPKPIAPDADPKTPALPPHADLLPPVPSKPTPPAPSAPLAFDVGLPSTPPPAGLTPPSKPPVANPPVVGASGVLPSSGPATTVPPSTGGAVPPLPSSGGVFPSLPPVGGAGTSGMPLALPVEHNNGHEAPPSKPPVLSVPDGGTTTLETKRATVAPTKYRILLRVGEGEPTFEVKCGDDLVMKVACEKVDIKSPEKGTGMSSVIARGKVRFAGFGAEGTCEELSFIAGTGEVSMSGDVKVQVKDKLGRVESELSTATLKYKIDASAVGSSIKP